MMRTAKTHVRELCEWEITEKEINSMLGVLSSIRRMLSANDGKISEDWEYNFTEMARVVLDEEQRIRSIEMRPTGEG